MKNTKNITKIVLSLIIALAFLWPSITFAATTDGVDTQKTTGTSTTKQVSCENSSQAALRKCLKANPIVSDLQIITNFLSAAVAIVVIGVIIVGGIQYSMAGDNPSAVTAAKKRITDGLLALTAYLLIFSLLQWLIPGGIFS